MLDRVLAHATYKPLLPVPTDHASAADDCFTQHSIREPQWCDLVMQAVLGGFSALIDAGALLAGVNIDDVAGKVRKRCGLT